MVGALSADIAVGAAGNASYQNESEESPMSDRTDSDLLDGLRSILGYVQNASDTVIQISVDDATNSVVVRVGRNKPRTYTGDSLRWALDRAIEGEVTTVW